MDALGITICSRAAFHGHLEVLKWARANGCPWNERACCGAAQRGHVEVLKWAVDNGCPWNKRDCMVAAATYGRLEVLQWLRANEPSSWDAEAVCIAAAKGSQRIPMGNDATKRYEAVLQWVHEEGCFSGGIAWQVRRIAEASSWDGVVQWLDDNKLCQ